MKVGDLVRYRGWSSPGPIAVVIDTSGGESQYHKRIRVMWAGDEVPIQAKVISVSGDRISSWVHPKHFEIFAQSEK